jgi:adenosylhomocysteine nucleosidase
VTDPAPTGILCALPQERVLLAEALASRRPVDGPGLEAQAGELDGRAVVVATSGVGKVQAAGVATSLVERAGCGALVFSGVAGGLGDELDIGDLVVADRVVDIDYGRDTPMGRITYQPGTLPIPAVTPDPGFRLPPSTRARIAARLEEAGLTAAFGTVLTTDAYLADPTRRDVLAAEWSALAVEMEGAAMCGVAERFGLPWLVVRALSDRAGEDSLTDFDTFLEAAGAASARLVRALLPALEP